MAEPSELDEGVDYQALKDFSFVNVAIDKLNVGHPSMPA